MKNCTEMPYNPSENEDENLLPCPSCGAVPQFVVAEYPAVNFTRRLFAVKCSACKRKVPTAFSTPRSAAMFWNNCAGTVQNRC